MSAKEILLDFDYHKHFLGDINLDGIDRISPNEFTGQTWISAAQDKLWVENYKKNKPFIKPYPKMDLRDRMGIIVGGSPAIRKNAHFLKECDDNFVIISSNTAAKFLVESGINPDFVFVVEGRDHVEKDFDFDTRELTLVASPFVSHKALMKWEGERYFYFLGGGKEYDSLFREDWQDVCDIDIGGGNVVSTSYLWAYKYLSLRHFAVIGMSLCFYDDYYHDGRKKADENLSAWDGRYQAMDIHGNFVNTTPPLTMYKTWMETYIRHAIEQGGGSFINCTEDGILGVMPEPVEQDGLKVRFKKTYIPWMSIVPLQDTIRGFKEMREEKHGIS